jgi:uncharacterized RDD family membrane protein YckC
MNDINKGIRLINVSIDILVIAVLSGILSLLVGKYIDSQMLMLIVGLIYYVVLEYFTGRTIGKAFTKTQVVDQNNSQPGFLRILARTLLRFNPFDSFSYLFGHKLGAHDIFSKTKLISTADNKNL